MGKPGPRVSWLNQKDKVVAARERELVLLEEMAKLKPQDANLQVGLGVLYAKKNLPDRAIPRLQSALALAPDDPGVLISVGDIYEVLGNANWPLSSWKKESRKDSPRRVWRTTPTRKHCYPIPIFRPSQRSSRS